MVVRPAKTQISLGIRPVWSESSPSAWRKLGSLATHWAHSEDSDQTGRMPRLIWVFAGRTLILSVLSCRGSFVFLRYRRALQLVVFLCRLLVVREVPVPETTLSYWSDRLRLGRYQDRGVVFSRRSRAVRPTEHTTGSTVSIILSF